jgi:hypothetical protein
MRFKAPRQSGCLFSRRHIIGIGLSISLAFFLCSACSREEESEVKRPKPLVRMGIPPQQKSLGAKKPESETGDTASEAVETVPPHEEKPSPPLPLVEQQEELKKEGMPEKEAPETTEIAVLETKKPPQLPQQNKEPEAGNEPETKQPEAERIAVPEENKPGPSPLPAEHQEEPGDTKQEDGHYRVQKGDSLFSIAGRKDVYGDPSKWPSLYRLNMDQLSKIEEAHKGLNQEALPEGLDLRFVTAQDAKENLAELGQKSWVVNVLSSRTAEKLLPPALKLMQNGYRVYIITVEVKGEEWMRLRVGFFADKPEAAEAGREIMSLLNSGKPWIVKIDQKELEEYGGY